MDILDVENEMFPIDVLHMNVSYNASPAKSPNDKKEYSVIKLSNGLTALLISDAANLLTHVEESAEIDSAYSADESRGSEASQNEFLFSDAESEHTPTISSSFESETEEKLAACALCIGVGSFSDPEEVQGMAHFLEHMVFKGSEKFPSENDFDSYISKRGGDDNAATECEYTTFFFDCHEIYLHSAMDRFAHFFISPLLKKDAMKREKEAIESEFQMSLPSDSSRREQLLCSLAVQNNPAHKFMWGNMSTLQDTIDDDFLHTALQEFWKRHYSAHRMTLVVQARLSLRTLEDWVVECFSNIPCNNLPAEIFPYIEQPFNDDFYKIFTVEPVKDICELDITWVLPSVLQLYKSKPLTYLSWVVGHEGEGSLISLLRNKLWALDITAGNGGSTIDSNSVFSLFSINLSLTEEGLKNLEQVLYLVFSYMKLLQLSGPVESIFNEIQMVMYTNFKFLEQISPSDYVENLAENMQFYPSTDYITGDELVLEYKPEYIIKFLEQMKPDKANIMISSKTAAKSINLDKTEPWFKTKYNVRNIPNKWKADWENCQPDPNFSLPKKNVYITTDFALLNHPETVPEYPQKIIENDLIQLWYKQDVKFLIPVGIITVNLIMPAAYYSARNAAMVDTFVRMLKQLVVEETYPALMANLQFTIVCGDTGIVISVYGFNQKLDLLLKSLLKHLVTFPENITEGLFEVIKQEQMKHYINKSAKPSLLSTELRLRILVNPYWTMLEKHAALSEVTLSHLKQFTMEFCHNLFVQCLIQGNISKNEACKISEDIRNILKYKPIQPPGLFPTTRVCQLPYGENICRIKSYSETDTNCDVTNYYQCGAVSPEEHCKVQLLMMMLEEPLFDTLRSKEQLSYSVSCSYRNTFGILGFSITVKPQAEKNSVDYVESRITNFLQNFCDKLRELTEEDFSQFKNSLIKLKQCSDVQLHEEVQRNWEEIHSNSYMFDRLKQETKHIESITLEDVCAYFEKCINYGTENCMRKLTLQIEKQKTIPKSGSTPIKLENNEHKTTDESTHSTLTFDVVLKQPLNDTGSLVVKLEKVKQNLYLYPVHKVS